METAAGVAAIDVKQRVGATAHDAKVVGLQIDSVRLNSTSAWAVFQGLVFGPLRVLGAHDKRLDVIVLIDGIDQVDFIDRLSFFEIIRGSSSALSGVRWVVCSSDEADVFRSIRFPIDSGLSLIFRGQPRRRGDLCPGCVFCLATRGTALLRRSLPGAREISS